MNKRNLFKTSLKKSNKGSAMVIVIVAMAFVGILAATIMWMALTNYRMKATDRRVKESFYTAETVFEQIMAGLQAESADAVNYAYGYVLQNFSDWENDKKESEFQKEYVKRINEALSASSSSLDTYKLETLMKYVDGNLNVGIGSEGSPTPGFPCHGLIQAKDDSGAYGTTGDIVAPLGEDYILLKGLHLEYTDQDGFLSIIDTDIMLSAPSAMFVKSGSLSDAFDYALIADDSFNSKASGTVTVAGNVYAGSHGINVDGTLALKDADLIVTKGDVTLNKTAQSFKVEKNSATSKTSNLRPELWADNVEIEKGNVDLDSKTFLEDDLSLNGNASTVKLSDTFYAFGNSTESSEDSSSIVVNGTDNAIDMTGVENLLLAGRAFTSSKDYKAVAQREMEGSTAYSQTDIDLYNDNDPYNDDDNEEVLADPSIKYKQRLKLDENGNPEYDPTTNKYITENELDKNGNPIPLKLTGEVMMGESIAIKGDQIAYLVPDECIGVINGVSICEKNPMTGNEYADLLRRLQTARDNGDTYYVVDVNKAVDRLNGNNLAYYGIQNSEDSLETVFVPSNGDTLVYFYMNFKANPKKADEYFRDYYNNHKARFDNYFNVYASGGIKSNTSYTRIMTSGNYLTSTDTLDIDPITLKNVQDVSINAYDTGDEVNEEDLETEIDNYKNVYNALCLKLSKNFLGLTEVEKGKALNSEGKTQGTVFSNLIIQYGADGISTKLHGGTETFTLPGANPYSAVVADANYEYTGDPKIVLIICTKNVKVSADYNGIIFAGGTIDVPSDVTITSAKNADLMSAVVSVLQQPLDETDPGSMKPLDFIRGAEDYIIAGTALKADTDTEEMRKVDYSQIVRYQNWIKR